MYFYANGGVPSGVDLKSVRTSTRKRLDLAFVAYYSHFAKKPKSKKVCSALMSWAYCGPKNCCFPSSSHFYLLFLDKITLLSLLALLLLQAMPKIQ